jgi:large subunit ribosomal protein L31e
MAETKTQTEKIEREYIIPLRRKWIKVPRYKRANKAIRIIKEFLARHMKIRDRDLNKIKLDENINEFVWLKGIRNPPIKIKVRATREGEIIKVELSEIPEKFKFKKARIEKREKEAVEVGKKKKEEEKPEERTEEEKLEEKKEAEEKKAAVVEAGKQMEKIAAKRTKHQTRISKQPKRQFRQALQK